MDISFLLGVESQRYCWIFEACFKKQANFLPQSVTVLFCIPTSSEGEFDFQEKEKENHIHGLAGGGVVGNIKYEIDESVLVLLTKTHN